MRAPNSDLKGHVLDDLALGRGGRLFNTWGGNWDTPARVKIVLIRSIAFHACGAQAQYILLYSGWGGLKLVSVTSVVSTTVSVWVLSCAVWRETTVVPAAH